MKIAILGLTISSAWGNGHATTYRALCKALHARGHEIRFLEKDVPWYREHRDLPSPVFCELSLYDDWKRAARWWEQSVEESDVIVVGSYFPDGVAAAEVLLPRRTCPVLFYDIDTPVTLDRLCKDGRTEALRAEDISKYDAYLTFNGGPVLESLKREYGATNTYPLYCSVNPEAHYPTRQDEQFQCELSYLGTYSPDRQPAVQELLIGPALQLSDFRFLLAGAQYPQDLQWPSNVIHTEHVPPAEHPAFYSSARFSLNITRESMIRTGWSPSVRLFEAAACGAAILSDAWPGLEDFFTPGKEISVVRSKSDVVQALTKLPASERAALGDAARARVLARHTSNHRAQEFEEIVAQLSRT